MIEKVELQLGEMVYKRDARERKFQISRKKFLQSEQIVKPLAY